MEGAEKGEEAAAVIFPLGVVLGFTFISPKRRRTEEGSQGSKRKTRRKRVRTGTHRENGKQWAEEGSFENMPFFCFLLFATSHPVSLPAAPPLFSEVLSVICKLGLTYRMPWK